MNEIKYEDWKPSGTSIALVAQAREICHEYMQAGYDLTLRQLYYQFVSRGLIANTQRVYKNLGAVISKARMAGLLDWDYIVDRTRNLEELPHWGSAASILRSAADGFQLDRWKEQSCRVEVWIEKDALTGVIEGICNELDVPYFSCRGYTSQSEMWRAAQRHHDHHAMGQNTIVVHLGDHDPSGIDMTRDIQDRLWKFEAYDTEVNRIALNWNQIEEFNPPPNPTKLTDSRSDGYVSKFGHESWELDALEPSVMVGMVRDEVLTYRDEDIYETTMVRERDIITGLHELADAPWRETLEWLRS